MSATEFIRLKKANCTNCYKCIRHCPVKAIRFSGGQAHIIQDACIYCGECFVICPQNAKWIYSETEAVKSFLLQNEVYVSLAPSFVSYFDTGISCMKDALKNWDLRDAKKRLLVQRLSRMHMSSSYRKKRKMY